MNEVFAVIDTETTWNNKLMSIGIAVADSIAFEPVDKRYYILLPNKNRGGMYSDALYVNGIRPDKECSYKIAVNEIQKFLTKYGVQKIFAYNAVFDYGHLPELGQFQWYDIMKMAAYRQYNNKIPDDADCFSTGRLKRGFGVESIYRLLSNDISYNETHNALFDAIDELRIMKMLGLSLEDYKNLST
ncbi:MAG: hypothetical protein NC320_09580 [Clostridium sp.]|nr:hypothetical protein [Clostridium sp.]MCM1547745.1 hypothetical protein [Ruminococcus sp.]